MYRWHSPNSRTKIFRKANKKRRQENNQGNTGKWSELIPRVFYLLAVSIEIFYPITAPLRTVGIFVKFISDIVVGFIVSFLRTLSENIFVVSARERTRLAE